MIDSNQPMYTGYGGAGLDRAPRQLRMVHRQLLTFALTPIKTLSANRKFNFIGTLCSMPSPRTTPALVTWDIDGTLLRGGGNHAHRTAIEDAVFSVYKVSTKVTEVPHAGGTDRAIIRDMCIKGGLSKEEIDVGMERAIADADERIVRYVEKDLSNLVLPGVREALEGLKKHGVKQALVTGNLSGCAWAKVNAAGLGGYFVGGGFGSDCLLRADILDVAKQRVLGGEQGQVVHVGDAVSDVQAARENGAVGVAVLTGSFGREALEAAGADFVFEDLADTGRFFKAIGIES